MKPFRVKVAALWRHAFPGLVLGAIAGRVILWVQGQPFSLPSTLPLMGVAAVMVALTYYLLPTLAGEQGLKVMNSWGLRSFLRWSDIKSVGFARWYLVQPSLKLTDHDGKAYWIAKDTKGLEVLHDLAVRHGGKDHPLAKALETPLYAL